MITADTSTWVAFLGGASGDDVLLLKKALQDHQLVMLPVVLTELLSDPHLRPMLPPVSLLYLSSISNPASGNAPPPSAPKFSPNAAAPAWPTP